MRGRNVKTRLFAAAMTRLLFSRNADGFCPLRVDYLSIGIWFPVDILLERGVSVEIQQEDVWARRSPTYYRGRWI